MSQNQSFKVEVQHMDGKWYDCGKLWTQAAGFPRWASKAAAQAAIDTHYADCLPGTVRIIKEVHPDEIVKVTAEERTGIERGHRVTNWRYIAHLVDGRKIVVRAKSTRPYPNAYLYARTVATGKSGLAARFSFGKGPSKYDKPIGSWVVVGWPVAEAA